MMKCVSQTFGQKYRVAVPTFSLTRHAVCWPIKMVLTIIKMVGLFACLLVYHREGQTTFGSWFYPFTMWIPGLKLESVLASIAR